MDLLALKCDIHGVTTHICQYTCCKCASESAVATPSASTNSTKVVICPECGAKYRVNVAFGQLGSVITDLRIDSVMSREGTLTLSA